MQKNKSFVAHRAWNFLRLALLWPRKGGLLKNTRRLMVDIRLLSKSIKALRNHHRAPGALHYGERELSFDDTPLVHVKMHRPSSLRFKMPSLPCINTPPVDFDYDFDHDYNEGEMFCSYNNDHDVELSRKSFLKGADDYVSSDEEEQDDDGSGHHSNVCEARNSCDDGIDLKAEQFIAKFYEQIKLQRQISYLQYNEMISRGANQIN